jgi:hypothetical protein
MTAFTYAAAYFSAVLFIGFAGKVGWGFGYSGLWIAAGNAFVGVLGVWALLGDRIRRMSVDYQVSTMPEFLSGARKPPPQAPRLDRFLRLPGSHSAAVFIGWLTSSGPIRPVSAALAVMGCSRPLSSSAATSR